MKFDQLVYFTKVAKLEHVGKAARAVGISSSAISHSIAALEEELGRELLSRDGKRVKLTNHGRILAKRAEALIHQVAQLKEEMAAEDVTWEGTLRMGAPPGLAGDCLVRAFAQLHQQYPKINGEHRNLRSTDILRMIVAGDLDFGLSLTVLSHPAVHKQVVFKGEVLLCVRQEHPILALPSHERLVAFRNYPVAGPRPVGEGAMPADCSATPLMRSPNVYDFSYDSYDIACHYMVHTDTWSFLPDWAIANSGGRIVAITDVPVVEPYEITALWPKDRGLSRPLKLLTQLIDARLQAK